MCRHTSRPERSASSRLDEGEGYQLLLLLPGAAASIETRTSPTYTARHPIPVSCTEVVRRADGAVRCCRHSPSGQAGRLAGGGLLLGSRAGMAASASWPEHQSTALPCPSTHKHPPSLPTTLLLTTGWSAAPRVPAPHPPAWPGGTAPACLHHRRVRTSRRGAWRSSTHINAKQQLGSTTTAPKQAQP